MPTVPLAVQSATLSLVAPKKRLVQVTGRAVKFPVDVIARNVLFPKASAAMSPERFRDDREVQETPSVEERSSPEIPPARTIPSPCARWFRTPDVAIVLATTVHVCRAGLDGSTAMPIVIDSGTPAASRTVTPRKWEMPFASRASTRMVLPGPSGTWRVTVIVVPVTGTVCTMSAIPAPRMVKRMAVTVDGIVADSGRGVAREEAVAGAAEAADPPIVTETAVVPSP